MRLEVLEHVAAVLLCDVSCDYILHFNDTDLMSALSQVLCCLAAHHAAADYKHLLAYAALAVEHVLSRDVAALLKSRNRKDERVGAGCKDDCIRLKLL